MSLNKFIIDTIERAANNDISVHFICDKDFKYGGLYDGDAHTLTVCVTDSEGKIHQDWLKLFIHESCHMDQDIEQVSVWLASEISDTNAFTIVDEWLNGIIELSPKQIETYIDMMQAIELDCEKRAIAKIKKYKLKIDQTQYIKEANAYLYFYEALKETRKWTKPGKGAYRIPEIVAICPDTYQKEYKSNREVIELIKKLCYD